MSLLNISFCRYLTKPGTTWTDDHYRARALVRAIKGDSFKGYAQFWIGGVWKTLDSDHPEVAFDWFVDKVATEIPFTDTTLICPIPGSQCTPTSTEVCRTQMMAQRLVTRVPDLTLWPYLKFRTPMQRKTRNEDALYANLICTAPVPQGDFLLLDDVCTTGAHARAAQRRLLERGATGQIVAMSAARTMLDAGEQVFGCRIDTI